MQKLKKKYVEYILPSIINEKFVPPMVMTRRYNIALVCM